MQPFKVIWRDVRTGQNLEIYITTLVAVIVAILDIVGVAGQAVVSSAILATLAVVSFSVLRNRREKEEIKNTLLQIRDMGHSPGRFLEGGFNPYDLREVLPTTRKAFLWGIVLTRTIQTFDYAIEQGLKSGLELRMLFIKPDSPSVEMAAFRSKPRQDSRELNWELKNNLSRLASIASAGSESKGKLEVRAVNHMSPWTIFALDPHLPTGYMLVGLSAFRVSAETRPAFELKAVENKRWFDFFVDQFEFVWEEAEPVNLEAYRKESVVQG